MQRAMTTALGLAALAMTVPLSAPAMAGVGGEAARLESARANARAGGPVSEDQADLLRRYGCLSGTDNDFCRRLEGRDRDRAPPPRRYKRRGAE